MSKVFYFPALLLSAALTGCVGSGPHTEQGAVTGGMLGAIAGGVIGNNSRGGDPVTGAVLGGVAGAVAGGAIGNSVDQQQGTVYGPNPPPGVYRNPDDRRYRTSRVQAPPPMQAPPAPPAAPQENPGPAPAPNAAWIPGYWLYDTRTYSWIAGHWEIPPPYAHTYVPTHNEVRNGQTVYVPGYWQ